MRDRGSFDGLGVFFDLSRSSGDIILNSGGAGLCSTWVKRRTTSSEESPPVQVVNTRTLAPGRLAPADLKKDANGFDLPIALGLLLASGQVAFDRPGNYAIVGELALTGETRPIKGILAMALQAVSEARA